MPRMTIEVDPSLLADVPVAAPLAEGRRFFEVDDGGCSYSIVARDISHAKSLLRDVGVELCDDHGMSWPIDDPHVADVEWKEISAERAAKVRVLLGDGGTAPASTLDMCDMGDWFSSEI